MAKKKKKVFVDESGKEWDLSQFNDTRSWNREKRVTPKSNLQAMPNILGRV